VYVVTAELSFGWHRTPISSLVSDACARTVAILWQKAKSEYGCMYWPKALNKRHKLVSVCSDPTQTSSTRTSSDAAGRILELESKVLMLESVVSACESCSMEAAGEERPLAGELDFGGGPAQATADDTGTSTLAQGLLNQGRSFS
jgi:hypothetical protein